MPHITCPRRTADYIACHPFSGSKRKNWPLKKFQELASCTSLPVRFCIGPEQSLRGSIQIENLMELAQWLANASAYVGNDSGISHLAAAVGTPSVVLFGPSDPQVWAPRGEHVTILRHEPLDELPMTAVQQALR
jgi:ADP-heptose:LPS heptosyltransferase